MKINEIKELHSKKPEELKALLKEARVEAARVRLELATKKIKNIRQLFFQKKKIARILTIMREKEFANG